MKTAMSMLYHGPWSTREINMLISIYHKAESIAACNRTHNTSLNHASTRKDRICPDSWTVGISWQHKVKKKAEVEMNRNGCGMSYKPINSAWKLPHSIPLNSLSG
jgi:hypothetical protein